MDPVTIASTVALTGGKKLVEKVVEKFIVPAIETLVQKNKLEDEQVTIGIRGGLTDYLERSLEKHGSVSTLVFPGQRMPLAELYVPLTVVRWSKSPIATSRESMQIVGYSDDFLPKHQRVFLVDNAGMGKSTLAKFLFVKCVEEQKATPVLIELRQLTGKTDILDHILEKVCGFAEVVSAETLLHLVVEGNFVFLLDGYDEISPSEKAEVTANLQAFIERASRNQFLLTSRPDPALQTFSEFERFEIRHLEKREALALIRRYDRGSELAASLISEIEKPKNQAQLKDYLINPLLVSLLFKAYEWKSVLPLRKHLFYEQVYNALYDMHDLSKGGAYQREKRSGLDSNEFHRVLRALAFRSLLEGKVEYPKDLLVALLQELRASLTGLQFEPQGFLHDILHAVPLFVDEGYGVRWSHKSMQEYFAAKYICTDAKGRQADFLIALFGSQDAIRFANALDLAHDIDVGTFNQTIIRRICEEFLQHEANTLPLAEKSVVPPEDRALRAALTFSQSFSVVPSPPGARQRQRRPIARKNKTRAEAGITVRISDTGLHRAFDVALDSARSTGLPIEQLLDPVITTVGGSASFFLVSMPSGIRHLLLEMLGAKGVDLVIRANALVDGRRISVSDLHFGDDPVAIDHRANASWNIEPSAVKSLNRLLAMNSYAFVVDPRRCAAILAQLDESKERTEAMEKLVRELR